MSVPCFNTAGLTMDGFETNNQNQAELKIYLFYSAHSSSFTKHGAYIAHNATKPLSNSTGKFIRFLASSRTTKGYTTFTKLQTFTRVDFDTLNCKTAKMRLSACLPHCYVGYEVMRQQSDNVCVSLPIYVKSLHAKSVSSSLFCAGHTPALSIWL